MRLRMLTVILAAFPITAFAQFVWPKPEYNRPEPGVYREDPFIVEYRRKFFSVFRGDFRAFNTGYAEIQALVAKNPRDARALVWLGNGQTVKAGVLRLQGDLDSARKLLATSRETLDRAVALRPKDPNIYMMRAATLYVQGMYWSDADLPRVVWERLRDDCLRFIAHIGPKRMPKTSIHLRGEAYGELGIAYTKLGEPEKARAAFQKVIELCPSTDYAKRAEKEIAALR